MNREIQIDIAIYNAGITRSRREYLAHPTADSCHPRHKCYWRQAVCAEKEAARKEARR